MGNPRSIMILSCPVNEWHRKSISSGANIKAEERHALRFLWQSPGSDDVTVYRFTQALFRLTCSPFLLGGVINEHLKIWETKYPELVKGIRDNLHVDDLITGERAYNRWKRKDRRRLRYSMTQNSTCTSGTRTIPLWRATTRANPRKVWLTLSNSWDHTNARQRSQDFCGTKRKTPWPFLLRPKRTYLQNAKHCQNS